MRSIFGKTMLAVGAIAAVSGCGPSEELEQGAGAEDTRAVSDPRTCGNDNLSDEQVAEMEARFEVAKARQAMGGQVRAMGASIPVYFHVIRDSSGNGGVTTTQVNNQLTVLNNA